MLTLLTNSLKSSNPYSITDYFLNIVITPKFPENQKIQIREPDQAFFLFWLSSSNNIPCEKVFFFDFGIFINTFYLLYCMSQFSTYARMSSVNSMLYYYTSYLLTENDHGFAIYFIIIRKYLKTRNHNYMYIIRLQTILCKQSKITKQIIINWLLGISLEILINVKVNYHHYNHHCLHYFNNPAISLSLTYHAIHICKSGEERTNFLITQQQYLKQKQIKSVFGSIVQGFFII